MAFKFVVLCTVLAVVNAGLTSVAYTSPLAHVAVANPSLDAVGATQQNVIRSYAGTVSQYSKAVDTPYSSVRKTDTRINNNVYTPAIAKTLTYAAPTSHVLTHAAPAVYAHAAPTVLAQPVGHIDPTLSAYSTKAISYSPAAAVAHVTFDGFGAHYGY